MKPRILFAGLFHETHTFVDGTTGWNNFLVSRGDEILAKKGDASPYRRFPDHGGLTGLGGHPHD